MSDYTYELVPYMIWVSIESNVVIVVASVPLLRPLFNGLRNRMMGKLAKHGSVTDKFGDISLTSMVSRKGAKSTHFPKSSSQEHIAPQQDPFTITQTMEVSVTTTPVRDVTLVHAALIGLVDDQTKASSIWH